MTDTAALEPAGSLARLLAWRNDERPTHPFVHVEDEGPWSIGDIAAAAVELTDRLGDAGIHAGDRVLVRLGNDERFAAALHAVWALGAVAVVMHPAAPVVDVERVVATMATRATVGDGSDPSAPQVAVPFLALGRLPRGVAAPRRFEPATVADDAEALVLLTSGSTGTPKGVVLTHSNGWANLRATVSAFRADTRVLPLPTEPRPPNLIANPVSHTAGVVRLLFALYVGRAVVLLHKFDPVAAKAALDRHGIDNLTINPAMMRMLLEVLPPGSDLGQVKYVSSGTAPLPLALRAEFEDRFGVPVLQAYGQTEAFGGVAIESTKDVLAGRRRPGSVGRALPGVEIRIVDQGGADLAPDADGEILVRTPSSTTGYLGDPGAASPVDVDGWLRTGDLGHLDADGYLYLTGRIKNLIICGGFNIVPEELEAALVEDPDVRDAAVVGIEDERLGEVPVAVVEGHGDPDAILERLADRLAPYKRPRRVFVVDELPRVPNGKVDLPAAAGLARMLLSRAAQPVE
jgi:long-chain acyl-CoA synthetase